MTPQQAGQLMLKTCLDADLSAPAMMTDGDAAPHMPRYDLYQQVSPFITSA